MKNGSWGYFLIFSIFDLTGLQPIDDRKKRSSSLFKKKIPPCRKEKYCSFPPIYLITIYHRDVIYVENWSYFHLSMKESGTNFFASTRTFVKKNLLSLYEPCFSSDSMNLKNNVIKKALEQLFWVLSFPSFRKI